MIKFSSFCCCVGRMPSHAMMSFAPDLPIDGRMPCASRDTITCRRAACAAACCTDQVGASGTAAMPVYQSCRCRRVPLLGCACWGRPCACMCARRWSGRSTGGRPATGRACARWVPRRAAAGEPSACPELPKEMLPCQALPCSIETPGHPLFRCSMWLATMATGAW